MPRVIEVATQPSRTDQVLERVLATEGIVGTSLARGTGIHPIADVITVTTTNRGARHLMASLADPSGLGILSVTSNEPLALISPEHQATLDRESTEASWTDVAGLLRQESNAELNILMLMFLAGAIAAVGIATDTIHIVVAAMVLTPGFEPFLRIPFSLIAGSRGSLLEAGIAIALGYPLLALGAAMGYAVLGGVVPTPPLQSLEWVAYWTSTDWPAVVTAVLAGTAGAVTVTANRSVFTAGVMIALALVPGMSLVGMGLVAGEMDVIVGGATQWAVNGVLVIASGALVIALKHVLLHERARSL